MIVDEFTDLKVSRQRKHQLRKAKLGLCINCGKPTVTKFHCRFHADAASNNIQMIIKRKIEEEKRKLLEQLLKELPEEKSSKSIRINYRTGWAKGRNEALKEVTDLINSKLKDK